MNKGRSATVIALLGCACGGSEPIQQGHLTDLDAAPIEAESNDVMLSTPEDDVTSFDVANEMGDASARDAAESLESAPLADGDSGCVELENIASPIDEATSADPEPTPGGGAIIDGTYVATQAVNYGEADAGYQVKNFRETVLITNGLIHLVRDLPGPVLSHVVASASYRVSGTTLFLEYFCGPTPMGVKSTQTSQYTSAVADGGAVALTVYDSQRPAELVVFSKR